MTLAEIRTRLADIAQEMPALQSALRARRLVAASLRHQQEAAGRPRTKFQLHDHHARQEAMHLLDVGIAREMGIAFDELAPFVGKPGIEELARKLARLEHEQAELRAVLDRWPTEDTRHPYRYTGRPYQSRVDGRELEPGDEVELTYTQALAWGDRFEAVSETTSQTGSRALASTP